MTININHTEVDLLDVVKNRVAAGEPICITGKA